MIITVLWWILVLLSPLLILITIHLIKELLSKGEMKFYTDQGIEPVYVPVVGVYKYLNPPAIPSKLPTEPIHKFYEAYKHNDKGMIVSNTYDSTVPTIVLTNRKTISEFLLQELECYHRRGSIPSIVDDSFFYLSGKKAMEQKAIFSGFFNHDNIVKMIPEVQRIFFNQFKKLNDLWKDGDTNEWKTVELSETLSNIFNDAVHILIFGDETPDNVPKINGKPFAI